MKYIRVLVDVSGRAQITQPTTDLFRENLLDQRYPCVIKILILMLS